jgi:CDP-diacylglycerol--glycerol-3-phosphate 3-phosphatidyltransferase
MARRGELAEGSIYNIPNFLTLLRVLLTLVLIYMFVFSFPVTNILIVFIIAASTDFFDGQIARRFNQVTRFGAKFDIIADRLLWISTGILLTVTFTLRGIFNDLHMFLIIASFTREILCFPVALYYLLRKKRILAVARWSGKTTTFLQGFAIPLTIISVYYSSVLSYAIFLAVLAMFAGIWAFLDYFLDLRALNKKR